MTVSRQEDNLCNARQLYLIAVSKMKLFGIFLKGDERDKHILLYHLKHNLGKSAVRMN